MDSDPSSSMVRAGLRGLVAAMAMSGMRQMTTGLGWLERIPPEEVLNDEGPSGRPRARAAVELAHWTYGSAGGAAFGLLPTALRRSRLAGPVYGLAVWLTFELGIAPVLGVRSADRRTVVSRLALAADHVLYGVVVAGQRATETPDDDEESGD